MLSNTTNTYIVCLIAKDTLKYITTVGQTTALSGYTNYDYVVNNENLTEDVDTCVICGEPIDGFGNNPVPVVEKGQCCDACNIKFVIPARIEASKVDEKEN